jgi:hypothetical protein
MLSPRDDVGGPRAADVDSPRHGSYDAPPLGNVVLPILGSSPEGNAVLPEKVSKNSYDAGS